MADHVTAADAEVVLAQPRGFCAGVDRAIDIVERALELHGAPIYVRHEIVHNRYVVEDLRAKGAVFIDELDQAPGGAHARDLDVHLGDQRAGGVEYLQAARLGVL